MEIYITMKHFEHKPAKFHFTEKQIEKIMRGHPVRVAAHQIGKGPHTLLLHPVQHHKISMAHAKGKGTELHVSPGEMRETIESGMEGTGIWDSIKNFFSKNGTAILDTLQTVGKAVAPEFAPEIDLARSAARTLTGKGLTHAHHTKAKRPRVSKHGNGLYL